MLQNYLVGFEGIVNIINIAGSITSMSSRKVEITMQTEVSDSHRNSLSVGILQQLVSSRRYGKHVPRIRIQMRALYLFPRCFSFYFFGASCYANYYSSRRKFSHSILYHRVVSFKMPKFRANKFIWGWDGDAIKFTRFCFTKPLAEQNIQEANEVIEQRLLGDESSEQGNILPRWKQSGCFICICSRNEHRHCAKFVTVRAFLER